MIERCCVAANCKNETLFQASKIGTAAAVTHVWINASAVLLQLLFQLFKNRVVEKFRDSDVQSIAQLLHCDHR